MAKQTFTTGQVLTPGQMTSLQQTAMGGGAATAKTTSYTLVAADAGTVVAMNSGSATTITVNTGLFAAGDTVQIQNLGAGVATITAGTATVSTSAVLTLKQYDAGTLYFVSTGVSVFFSADAADSPLTTKGDLYTYSTTNARLAVGANGTVLTADSTQANGVIWAAVSGGSSGLTLISTTALSASGNFNINGCFSATYDNYLVTLSNFTASTTCTMEFGLRIGSTNATGTDYKNGGYYVQYSTAALVAGVSSGIGRMSTFDPGTSTTTNGAAQLFLSAPFKTTNTTFDFNIQLFDAVAERSGVHALATSYDSMWFTLSAGTVTGNISIYGLAK